MTDIWFRMYNTFRHDRKICHLSDFQFRAWIGLLSLASESDGKIPRDDADLSFELRVPQTKVAPLISGLINLGLIEDHETFLAPHNWNTRQFKSDVSTARVQRFRERQRNVSGTPDETDHSRDRTETEQNRTLIPRPIVPKESKDINFFNGNGLGNGKADYVTIRDPLERIARFQQKLLPFLGSGGWGLIADACDASKPNHEAALARCKEAATAIGKKWPRNWPTNLGA